MLRRTAIFWQKKNNMAQFELGNNLNPDPKLTLNPNMVIGT